MRASKLQIAYLAQHQLDELHADELPAEHVRRLMPGAPESKVRSRAAEMGFSASAADTKVAQLSGGEKARLLLGLAAFHGPHLLILDEPTNHLDIEARAALISAVNDFPGAVVLVSHDRHLLDACADRLWLVADGTVKPFEATSINIEGLCWAPRARTSSMEKEKTSARTATPAAMKNAPN